jgi:WD40 repeat protein
MRIEDSENSSKKYKLVPKITISDNTSEVFCVKFSPDGKFIAAGCGDGAIRVFFPCFKFICDLGCIIFLHIRFLTLKLAC